MALEMDLAMDYLGDMGDYFKKREDMNVLEECEEIAADAIEEHINVMEQVHAMILAENEAADEQVQEMLALQAACGIEVEQPVYSIEG